MQVKTNDKVPLNLKVWSKDLQKYFETGESVMIISGLHSGGAGIITSIDEKHALVSMEGTKSELKILLSNLKVKGDDLDYVKLKDYI